MTSKPIGGGLRGDDSLGGLVDETRYHALSCAQRRADCRYRFAIALGFFMKPHISMLMLTSIDGRLHPSRWMCLLKSAGVLEHCLVQLNYAVLPAG
jgi:hypothetical protein